MSNAIHSIRGIREHILENPDETINTIEELSIVTQITVAELKHMLGNDNTKLYRLRTVKKIGSALVNKEVIKKITSRNSIT